MIFDAEAELQRKQKLVHLSHHAQFQLLVLFLFNSGTPTPASDADATTLRGQFSSKSCQSCF